MADEGEILLEPGVVIYPAGRDCASGHGALSLSDDQGETIRLGCSSEVDDSVILSGSLPLTLGIGGQVMQLAGLAPVSGSISLGLGAAAQVNQALNVARPEVASKTCHATMAAGASASFVGGWQVGAAASEQIIVPLRAAAGLQQGATGAWQQGADFQDSVQGRWEAAQDFNQAGYTDAFQDGYDASGAATGRFQEGASLPGLPLDGGYQETHKDRGAWLRNTYQEGAPSWRSLETSETSAQGFAVWHQGRYQEAQLPGSARVRLVLFPGGPEWPRGLDCHAGAGYLILGAHGGRPEVAFLGCPPKTNNGRSFIMRNSLTLRRVETDVYFDVVGLSLSLDDGSWTWAWQAEVTYTAEAHTGLQADGDPAEMEIVINGFAVRVLLEKIEINKRHLPAKRLTLSGRGISAILSAPYSPVWHWGNPTGPIMAAQAADAVLTANNVSIGWAVDFTLEDWEIPQGAWANSGVYVDGLQHIAKAAGAYVQPTATTKTVRLLHYYPVAPWGWGLVEPDFVIPFGAVEVERIEHRDKPAYNKIFLGGQHHGVWGPMKRAGTAGDLPAGQYMHPLITGEPAWRQAARKILSDTGIQRWTTIEIPVFEDQGLIMPGAFVQYGPAGAQTFGIVRGLSVSCSMPRIRQTLEIETHG